MGCGHSLPGLIHGPDISHHLARWCRFQAVRCRLPGRKRDREHTIYVSYKYINFQKAKKVHVQHKLTHTYEYRDNVLLENCAYAYEHADISTCMSTCVIQNKWTDTYIQVQGAKWM